MDPQAPNIQEPSQVEPATFSASEIKTETPKNNNSITIISMAVFVLLTLGAVAFLYNQNQQLKKMIVIYQVTPTPQASAIPSKTPDPNLPIVSSPSANMKIVSPLIITGTVPTGWMFEGQFPIKLVDSKDKLIVQGVAKEKVAGSWQSGKTVDFTSSLTFPAATGAGTLILENDNPSGLPANLKTFELPVNF